MLDRKEAPGSTHPGLDFVGYHQGPVLAAERGRSRKKFVGGHVDALALDRLDNEGCDFARRQRLLEGLEIVERHRSAAGQQRLEPGAEVRIIGQGKGAVGQAVIGVRTIDDAGPAGGAAGEFNRSFDTFCP
jgi:hypothetical protein